MKIRYYIIVEGSVQGVGFRNYAQYIAVQHSCTGWAHNLDNGMVEIQIQGEQNQINNVFDTLKKGNMFIQITNYQIKEIPLVENENKFHIY